MQPAKLGTVNPGLPEFLAYGMKSFWSMMKRWHDGIYHKLSPKQLQRYVDEFAGRHYVWNSDTIDQIEGLVTRMIGKRLRYDGLTAGNGLSFGTRSGVKVATT